MHQTLPLTPLPQVFTYGMLHLHNPFPSGVYIPYKDIDIINWIYSSWAFHEGVTTKTFNKAQKNAFFKHYFTHTEARNISDERKKYILNAKSLHFSFACRKDFALGLVNYHGIIYTEEQNNILPGSQKFLNNPIPVSLIFKKPKHRQEKRKFNWH